MRVMLGVPRVVPAVSWGGLALAALPETGLRRHAHHCRAQV